MQQLEKSGFSILEASIEDHRNALDSGEITSLDLVISYLHRIAIYDTCAGLNAFTVFNLNILKEATASDARRAEGLTPRSPEGIPYTLKDSYKYAGLSVTNGSPALADIMSNEDSAIAKKLRDAGAVLIGKTNMPPMAAGEMQRGLYGRAESPYNSKYLTAAFSSGSSNGAATSIASSMAVFGMGSETVSSGRSPASNNALVCYTPSRGVLSCRGLWPLYIMCDVPVPYARSVSDLLEISNVIATSDTETTGDFWREQNHVPLSKIPSTDYLSLRTSQSLQGKRIGVPKMYIGQHDSNPYAKHPYVSNEVVELWHRAAEILKDLGADIVYRDFPLVTNYENDSISGEANNVTDAPSDWNHVERSVLIAKAWNDFLAQNGDEDISDLASLDPTMLFPKPRNYVPDRFLEVRNWIDYAGLSKLSDQGKDISIHNLPGISQAVNALEAQRKRDLEDWMDENKFDVIAFPAQGDVGLADLEINLDSTKHSLQNGVKYSNGNRAIRHLGVPTVNVPMGVLPEKRMPMNITFAGKAYSDTQLLEYAYAFEQATTQRIAPPLTPKLPTDTVYRDTRSSRTDNRKLNLSVGIQAYRESNTSISLHVQGILSVDFTETMVQILVDGQEVHHGKNNIEQWNVKIYHVPKRPVCLGWDLKPLNPKRMMVIVIARGDNIAIEAEVRWVPII